MRNGGDGTELEDWSEVDVDLVQDPDGSLRPKGHPSRVRLSGGSSEPVEELVTIADRGDAESVIVLGWGRSLPKPSIDGPRATYANVLAGVDLVLEVTRTGVEQYLVVKERPADAGVLDLSVPVRARGRYRMAQADDASVSIVDGDREVARTSAPEVWDARVDQARQHPLTAAWQWDAPGRSGLARSLGDQPEWAKIEQSPKVGVAPERRPMPEARPTVFPEVRAVTPPGVKPGRGATSGNADPRTVPNLRLDHSVSKVSEREASVSLSVPRDYLDDPATTYPVVVDPTVDYLWGFDTWVSKEWANTDKSAATFLRLGGAAGAARSFIHFNVAPTAGKAILDARLNLWETHSWSCEARNWQLWDTGLASTSTRWASQPSWNRHWATSSQTTGYSASCADNWVFVDARALVQAWADNGHTGTVAVGLKAENEADNFALKEFNSANAGSYVPAIWARYDSRPDPSTDLNVVPGNALSDAIYTNSSTPMLRATGRDADGDDLYMLYRLHSAVDGPQVWEAARSWVPQGVPADVSVASNGGVLNEGSSYYYVVHSKDTSEVWNTAHSGWRKVVVDLTAPPTPLSVGSPLYKNDGSWNGDANVPGSFTVALGSGETNPAGFLWGVNGPPTNKVSAGNEFSFTPTVAGRYVLNVQAIDKAGNTSPSISYAFNVGQGAIVSPSDGSRVVRRTRLQIDALPSLTSVKFQWRRGPEAVAVSEVPASLLSTAAGQAFPATGWISRTSLGEYAAVDAAQLLGYTGGPFQVRPVFKGADGAEKVGAWVSIFVDPDADGAAADMIGPGSVNLVTGDYSVSATDADEFGLTVGRTSSSRDPRLGLVPQHERLTTVQQSLSGTAGFYPKTASLETVPRGHTGGDGGRLLPTAEGTNTFVAVEGDTGGLRMGLRPGRTYRFSGWIFVPDATGLQPDSAERGLRLGAFWRVGAEPYQSAFSAKPPVTDSWQQLSVDFTVPVGATEAFVRLYNGFAAGSGKEVLFDDLSLREVWAPLGPQWAFGTGDDAAETDYLRVERTDDVAVVHTDGGGEIWFTASGDGRWYPEVGAEGLNLTLAGEVWTLAELDGTTSVFRPKVAGGHALLETTSPPAAPGATRMVYEVVEDISRLVRIIGPTEPGIDANGCTNPVPAVGCEVTQLAYAPATIPKPAVGNIGAYPGQVSTISVWSTRPDTRAIESQVVAEYRYDDQGRLVETWDPRVSPPLKTVYGYDAAGHITSLTPAGELPWRFTYAASPERTSPTGDLIDANPGRLRAVTRASLVEGSANQPGPDNTTTVVYGVPLTRAAGGPHDMDAAALVQWGQQGAPTDATAVFGPHAVPASPEVTPTSPGADGYAAATVHYLDASGREVNTASPIGGQGADADLKRLGYIDTTEYDRFGNTTRTLDATNRLIALGKGPTAVTDLAELNLTGLSTAQRAVMLSSQNTYSADGIDLLRTVDPVRVVSTSTGPRHVRLNSRNTYDEAKPDAQVYHLATTSTTSAQTVDFPDDPTKALDAVTTRTSYAPTPQLGGESGWKLRKSTAVSVGEGAAAVTSYVKYDANGRTLESRRPSVAGVADWGTQTLYYTAGPNPSDAACGNRPEWAGQPCVTRPTGQIAGADTTRMGTTLPSKRVEVYSRYGTAVKVSETATGPGATQRTTTTTLDAAERTETTAIAVTAGGQAAQAVETVTTVYDSASGHAVESKTAKGSVKRTLDVLGRTLTYTDASGASATSTYDRFGQPKTYSEKDKTGASVGSRTFSYDRNLDPRGFLTSVNDSVAGTVSATYGPDGQVLTQTMPGGVNLQIGYDATRTPTTRTYTTGSGGVIATSAVTVNTKGKWASHATTASTSSYAYDPVGRLTGAQQTVNGVCTWRQYDFNARSDRTAKRTKSMAKGVACPGLDTAMGTPTQSVGYTYDSADRLVADTSTGMSPWAYDGLGRMTAMRSVLDPNVTVKATYFDNDRLASQTIDGVATMTWTLDPLGRFDKHTNSPVGGTAVTKQNHYTDDGDSPSWIHENTADPDAITRYVDGPDGQLALSTSKTGGRVLNLVDLHGDVMATLPVADGAAGTANIGQLSFRATDEFGVPLDLNSGGVSANAPPRYGYLGGAQRSAETLGGTILMGARVYQAAVGRFTSIDAEPGGNASEYDYVFGDPVNNTDLTGNWPDWRSVLGVVARVAEVASFIPGPIGTAAGFMSAGAYLATGNTRRAAEMAITGAAALVGAGLVARAAFKFAGRAASLGRKVVGTAKKWRGSKVVSRGCNSFTGDTPVLLADGSQVPIAEVDYGDWVWATDPTTGRAGARQVTDLISYGGLHLMVDVTLEDGTVIAATDLHPFWNADINQWVDAIDLKTGDTLTDADGNAITVAKVATRTEEVWAYNLTINDLHTYHAGNTPTLVHNSKIVNGACNLTKPGKGKGSVPQASRDSKRLFPRALIDLRLQKVGGKCEGWCGKPLKLKDARGHHVKRHADGGRTTYDNLAVLCQACHRRIHKRKLRNCERDCGNAGAHAGLCLHARRVRRGRPRVRAGGTGGS